MINNISWASYWTALTILLLLYYAGVLSLFYLPELRHFFSGSTKLSAVDIPTDEQLHDESVAEEMPDLPKEVEALASELTSFLEQAKYAGSVKEEILFGVQQILKKYPSIKDSTFQVGINRLLEFEAKTKCAVHLSHEELRQVWLS